MDGAAVLITADDYGYAAGYDAGILTAAQAGAVDAVSVMVMRTPDPGPLPCEGRERRWRSRGERASLALSWIGPGSQARIFPGLMAVVWRCWQR